MPVTRRPLPPEEQKKLDEYIMRRRAAGVSIHQIAKETFRDKSTVTRIVRRMEKA